MSTETSDLTISRRELCHLINLIAHKRVSSGDSSPKMKTQNGEKENPFYYQTILLCDVTLFETEIKATFDPII